MLEELKECKLCPHMCKINRLEGRVGRCKATDKLKISLVSLHHFEEPCISGTNGSGTIFFSNCNFNCVFCQNYKISQEGMGQEVDIDFLAKSMIEQQEKGAHNINLVTPVMYVYHIIEAIKIAKAKGLSIECVDINVNPELRKSRLFKNMFVYIIRSIFTMLRMFIIYRPFRFFAVCGVIFLLVGLILSGRFIYFYLLGSGQGHVQSLIFAAVFLLSGVQIGLIAVLAELISINRKLLEDIQKRVKLDGLQKNSDDLK